MAPVHSPVERPSASPEEGLQLCLSLSLPLWLTAPGGGRLAEQTLPPLLSDEVHRCCLDVDLVGLAFGVPCRSADDDSWLISPGLGTHIVMLRPPTFPSVRHRPVVTICAAMT